MRVSPGKFALREPGSTEYVARRFEKRPKRSEEVRVFPVKLLRKIGWFHGIKREFQNYLPLLSVHNTRILPRVDAESDTDYKQIISYVLVRRKSSLLRFVRGNYNSVESFLRGSECIGFGGHVEANDLGTLFDQGDSGYLSSLIRELTEELKIPETMINEDNLQMVGVLNDDSSIVGKLHFAFVHILDISGLKSVGSAKELKRERSINQLRFVPIADLGEHYERYEYWSKLCIQEFFKGTVTIKCRIHPVRNFKLSKHSRNIAVVGMIGSGKTELTKILQEEFGYSVINSGRIIQDLLGVSIAVDGRAAVQKRAQEFIQKPDGPERLANEIVSRMGRNAEKRYLIDGIRNVSTFDLLKSKLDGDLTLIYVESTVDNCVSFYRGREDGSVSFDEFVQILQHPVERDIPRFLGKSNVVIFNHGSKKSYQDEVRKFFKEELQQ
jgi:predicted NUDIX family phosphoesterase/dephospho-CoA kinase